MARRFYLEHDVEINGKQVKILGITHGSWKFPLGRTTAKVILEKVRENPKAATYHEGPLPNNIIPKELHSKALSLEPYHELEKNRALWENAVAHLPNDTTREKLKLRLTHVREFIGFPEKIPDDMGKLSERKRFKSTLVGPNPEQAAAAITIYRSLLMADRLLAAPENHIIAVMGAAHTLLVKKFLENPKLRERYRKLWEK